MLVKIRKKVFDDRATQMPARQRHPKLMHRHGNTNRHMGRARARNAALRFMANSADHVPRH
jgi:hypothetical protein